MDDISILKQSLPYIRAFRGKTFVVKIGGEIIARDKKFTNLATDLSLLYELGIRIVVIHGGGPQLSSMSQRLGVKQQKIAGRRITDDDTLELAKMVFSGISTDILSALRQHGTPSVGLSGIDGDLIFARRRPARTMEDPETGELIEVDFQNVGDIVSVNVKILEVLLANRFVPVVASLGSDMEGNIFNINADTIASRLAQHLKAEKLFSLSDVKGVLSDPADPDSIISYTTVSGAQKLIENKTVRGGMIPKLETAIEAVQGGVGRAHIVNGFEENTIIREVFTKKGYGTMVIRDEDEQAYLGGR